MNFATQEFRAEARFQRVSPQKARLVLDLIKGKRVGAALETLMFTNKAVAPSIEKLLRSAVQNANYVSQEKGLDVDVDNLFVKRAIANEGPRMKRIRPAPMGRAYRYQRRISHIEIAVAEKAGAQSESLVTTVEEPVAASPTGGAKKSAAKKKAPAKKSAAKKSAAKKSAPAKKKSAPKKKAGK
ncbi:MAG: 50S ribosomal protein L22 [Acidobacteriales bacterium]|nr:50S ribosomal protein L22 [Terriglobales bacterium]